ncbi:FMN-dependent dehydrogenase-domain-containing protein [Chiua virens]|nr:FMN-dependent dehydrogenase-domain-containing protein [Chiua virens]
MPTYNLAQVARHNTSDDHPGGPQVIMGFAGRDATAAYVPIHPADALDKNIAPEKHLGDLDEASIIALKQAKQKHTKTRDDLRVEEAQLLLTMQSAADDSIILLLKRLKAHAENARAFSRFFFHPRVMRTVSGCDTSSTILGYKTSIPVYISGSALARLGHPLGEVNLTRGAYETGIIQMVSSNSSMSYGRIAAARGSPDHPIFFQLYKHKDDATAAKRIQEVEAQGYNAIFLTVDALVPSNREMDTRAPHYLEDLENEGVRRQTDSKDDEEELNMLGTAGGLIINNDIDMTWERTIPWMRSVTKLPIVIKGEGIRISLSHVLMDDIGIQCVADAVLAAEAGCEGIVLSNHGGDSLPPLEVLYKLRKEHPEVFKKTEGMHFCPYVLKALCLGAKAVGLGRAFLYAQSAYGEAGVVHLVRILQREIKFGMESLGVRSVDLLSPEMVERVDWHAIPAKL